MLTSPADIVLGPRTPVQPDLRGPIDPEHPRGIERCGHAAARHRDPLSTAACDRGAKRRIYRAAGVAEYWIVDPDARLIERWTPSDTRGQRSDRPGGGSRSRGEGRGRLEGCLAGGCALPGKREAGNGEREGGEEA
ncbi:MAG: Uma2 family endonuclease [Gemmatimonadetes bacterium]|nr:Uma2 family endonuclease [Gemmatimonadota bacterium]